MLERQVGRRKASFSSLILFSFGRRGLWVSAGGERNWWGKRKVPAEQRGVSPTSPLAPPDAFTLCSLKLRRGARGPGLCLVHSRTPERLACRRYSVGPFCIELGFTGFHGVPGR